MNRLLSAALIAVAAPSAQAGDPAVRQACLEVTGAINPVGDDHTCALWAKGKYFHQEDEYENGKPVWHREQSEVLHWGVVVRSIAPRSLLLLENHSGCPVKPAVDDGRSGPGW